MWRIDGRGKFVVPGLADMHAHLYADEWVDGIYISHRGTSVGTGEVLRIEP